MSEKSKRGWEHKTDSFTKLIVYFKNGNTRTFYSRDWRQKYSKNRDRELGLKRLRKLVAKYGIRANGAVIYDTETRALVEKYYEGILIDTQTKPLNEKEQ